MPEGLIAPALRRVVRGQANTKVVLSAVTELDLAGRRVSVVAPKGAPMKLPYDILVVAAGATHAYFGHDEWAAYAPGMKTLEDARHLRNHNLGAFELAELTTDPAESEKDLTRVVVGAAPTGVEVVGQIAKLAYCVMPATIARSTRGRPGWCSSKPRRPCSARSTRSCSATPKLGSNGWASNPLRHNGDRDGRRQHHGPRKRRRGAHSRPDEGLAAGVKASPLARSARPRHGR